MGYTVVCYQKPDQQIGFWFCSLCYQKPDQQTGFWFCSLFYSCSDPRLYTRKGSPDSILAQEVGLWGVSDQGIPLFLLPSCIFFQLWMLQVFLLSNLILLFLWGFLFHLSLSCSLFWFDGQDLPFDLRTLWFQCTPLAFSLMGQFWPLGDINI